MERPARIVPRDGLSWVCGDTNSPISTNTVAQQLYQTSQAFPDNEAAVFCSSGVRYTYKELACEVDKLATGLLSIGVYKGDRVAIWSPNRPEWLLTQFATARIGAILVNINPAYGKFELEYALNKVKAHTVISAVSFKSSRYLEMLLALSPELSHCAKGHLSSESLPYLKNVVQLGDEHISGMYRFSELRDKGSTGGNRARLNAISRSLSPDDAINIQFTSGTTGSPKGATLTHRNIVNNANFCAQAMRLGHNDRLCIPVPLYHCFGMVLGNLASVNVGATMVFPDEGFEPLSTLRALEEKKCTAVHGVPTMFVAMLNEPTFSKFDLRQMRTGIMAGAPCPEPLMKQVINKMHLVGMTIAYGMTETSPVSFQSAFDDSIHHRVSTVGRIQPHAEVKIVDDHGDTLRVGEQGELCTRGYLVMQGYWDDAERTRETIDQGGWMHTGDLATIDIDGYCQIVGRVTDMIIRGGENVYPKEIEEFLLTHPDIIDAQVFGIPNEKYGEEVCAWIILKPSAVITDVQLVDWCKGKIAHFKIPRQIRFVSEMPMTVTGKPQKFIMREEMLKA